MSTIRSLLGVALTAAATAACYVPAASAQVAYPEPVEASGPPGGYADPGYGYPQPGNQPVYSQGAPQGYGQPQYPQYPNQGYPDPASQGPGYQDPSQDPQQVSDPASTMADVNDAEIDATLEGHGTWVDDPTYGRVWRPDVTSVGLDFTPYETDGSWVESEYGWTFDSGMDWGWLPFHYGRWGWFDGYWGWVPGYQWGPAWVEWRHGGGLVGWRPLGPMVRDHRHWEHDSSWRFASTEDFGRGHIRGHLYTNNAEGLRLTQPIARPPIHSSQQVGAATTMRGRPVANGGVRPSSGWNRNPIGPGQARVPQQAWRNQPAQPWHTTQPQPQTWRQPTTNPQTFRQPEPVIRQPQQTWRQPQPAQPWRQPQPAQTWRQPQQTWRQPAPSRPTYTAPTYSAPSHPTYSAPSHPSYSAPSHSSYSAPSHSSGGGGGGGGHSGGGGGHSGGGGHGGHR